PRLVRGPMATSRGLVENLIEERPLQALPKISARHYFAVFVLSAATLSYQILVSRFFSVMLHHHFAFAAISLAMLGLTRGAMEVYGKPDRYTTERLASNSPATHHGSHGGVLICSLRHRDHCKPLGAVY